MSRGGRIILFFSSGGMMLCWAYTLLAFLLTCFSQPALSLIDSAGILFSASIVSHWEAGKTRTRMTPIGIHLAGLLMSTLWLCHGYYGIKTAIWRPGWVGAFFSLERGVAAWFLLVLMVSFACALWFLGKRLAGHPPSRTTIHHRFDFGLACFLFLFLIKLLIAVKGGTIAPAHCFIRFFLIFIVLGLFSMAAVNLHGGTRNNGATYIRGIGVVASFTVVILVFVGSLTMLFLPELQSMAETGAGLLKTLKEPLEMAIVALYRFSFSVGRPHAQESGTGNPLPSTGVPGKELGIFHYLFIGFTILVLTMMAVFLIYCFVKWLWSRIVALFSDEIAAGESLGIIDTLWLFFRGAWRLLMLRLKRVSGRPDPLYAIKSVYLGLLRWGRSSGVPHQLSETPREYGMRLVGRFPRVKKEIEDIIHAHESVFYGNTLPNSHMATKAGKALKRMANPALWFARIRSIGFHDRG
jgi:hypothetical protein